MEQREQFFQAIERDDARAVLTLIDQGLSVHDQSQSVLYALSGHTPLTYAASNNALKCIKALLDRGAYINTIGITSKMTPLMMAAMSKQPDAMNVLLRYPSALPIDIEAKDLYGRTAASCALDFSGHTRQTPEQESTVIKANQCLKLLAAAGIDITKATNQRGKLLVVEFINNFELTTKYPGISRDIVNTFILEGLKLIDKNAMHGSRKELGIVNHDFITTHFKEFLELEESMADHQVLSSTINDEHANNDRLAF